MGFEPRTFRLKGGSSGLMALPIGATGEFNLHRQGELNQSCSPIFTMNDECFTVRLYLYFACEVGVEPTKDFSTNFGDLRL